MLFRSLDNLKNRFTRKTKERLTDTERGVEMSSLSKTSTPLVNRQSDDTEERTRSIVNPLTSHIKDKDNLGFTESLISTKKEDIKKNELSVKICDNIFSNGLNVNGKYFYPSQFPNLTKTKSISNNVKVGGKNVNGKRRRKK